MHIRLYDGWNYFRMIVEKDMTSLAPRRLYQDMRDASNVLHIWVWDGRGARAVRQAIFPDYKTKRKPAANDIQASIEYFRQMLTHTTAYSIEIPGFEGDDVIAALVDHYTTAGAQRIEIYSNDYDLAQLQAGRPHIIGGWRPHENVQPHEIQTYKTFCGDSSDTICGVKGFGEKCWDSADKKVLRSIALACVREKSIDELVPHMFLEPVRGENSVKNWVLENQEKIAQMWTITGFIPLPDGALVDNMKRPLHDPAKVEEHLKMFLL